MSAWLTNAVVAQAGTCARTNAAEHDGHMGDYDQTITDCIIVKGFVKSSDMVIERLHEVKRYANRIHHRLVFAHWAGTHSSPNMHVGRLHEVFRYACGTIGNYAAHTSLKSC